MNYAAGGWPTSVTTGDFNGDGRPDLAVTNMYGSVSILLGVGDGTFQTAMSYAAGISPQSVTTGDFNGDGRPDLAVVNYGGGVSILLGVGDGTFQAAVNYAAGSNPRSVTTGDFNGDGRPDLAVTNVWGGSVSILLGVGDGTFQTRVNYAAGSFPWSVTTGDFNGDGRPDLAVANYGYYTVSRNVSILLGVGDGTFQAAVSYAVRDNPISVTTGDFNGDGRPDLAVANADTYSSGVTILLGVGDGTFQTPVNYAVGGWPNSVTTGDFNGDGRPDLAMSNFYSHNVSILLNTTPQRTLTFIGPLSPYASPDERSYKVKSAIPIKWQYADASGNVINSSAMNPMISIAPFPCSGGDEGAAIMLDDAGQSGYQYDSITNTWQFNWKTTDMQSGCYNIRVTNSQTSQINGPFPIKLVR